ncbi:MAG: hypothetical protein KAJ54_01775 [Candidatus Aenigmarchaeota archaeon]|nr:hypothetical protein [Candidatus Aenigmarchaeota archaeon]MCK5321885.1 hypothetical protein [Candidatus Aenigmarchaeota archaeon]
MMKAKVICKKCNSQIEWQWGNLVSKCDCCGAILCIKDVTIDKESRQEFMPLS